MIVVGPLSIFKPYLTVWETGADKRYIVCTGFSQLAYGRPGGRFPFLLQEEGIFSLVYFEVLKVLVFHPFGLLACVGLG